MPGASTARRTQRRTDRCRAGPNRSYEAAARVRSSVVIVGSQELPAITDSSSTSSQPLGPRPSLAKILQHAPWAPLEEHLTHLRERVDGSVEAAHALRRRYREELLTANPDLPAQIRQPSTDKIEWATSLLSSGTLAAADGTVTAVPLLGGSKIQVAVVIVFNYGDTVQLVTRVFEHELVAGAATAQDHFSELRKARFSSNLVSRALMLFGERRLLFEQSADWRMIHGELIPYELRTGAGYPQENLDPAFQLAYDYIASEQFIAVSEGPEDLDILNAAILLEPGDYIVIRNLTDDLTTFLDGDAERGLSQAKFSDADRRRFRQFIERAGPKVAIVLVKAAQKPFIIECHADRVEEAVALFLTDSLWTRGLPLDGTAVAARGFPFHLDLADHVARTIFRGSEFRGFVESRLMDLGVEEGLFDLDPRRTRR